MDPQKLSQLDPKLKEAYQRVMATPLSQPQTPSAKTQTPPPPVGSIPDPAPQFAKPTPPPAAPYVPLSGGYSPIIAHEEIPRQAMQPPIQPFTAPKPQQPLQPTGFDQMNSEISPAPLAQTQTIPQKKKKHFMIPFLIGIVVLVFILAYTFFWTKIFNFKLPF